MDGGGPQTTFYVQVEDIEASLQKAAELGGETVAPVTVIPGMVTFAQFKDPRRQRNWPGLFRGAAGLI
jgi:predicted enzyme related to lactoylglutathione lyase